MTLLADGFSAMADDFLKLFAIVAFATLLLCLAASADGAQPGATRKRKLLAAACGCLGGFAVAATVFFFLLLYANSLAGLVLGPLFGGAVSYVGARAVASGFLT